MNISCLGVNRRYVMFNASVCTGGPCSPLASADRARRHRRLLLWPTARLLALAHINNIRDLKLKATHSDELTSRLTSGFCFVFQHP